MTERETLHPLRPMLKNFVWEHGRVGTRYLDCSDGEVKFDDGKKSRFAAEKYLYVPLGKDAVDDPKVEGPSIREAAQEAVQRGTTGQAGGSGVAHGCTARGARLHGTGGV
jgi:hypothetical protein